MKDVNSAGKYEVTVSVEFTFLNCPRTRFAFSTARAKRAPPVWSSVRKGNVSCHGTPRSAQQS